MDESTRVRWLHEKMEQDAAKVWGLEREVKDLRDAFAMVEAIVDGWIGTDVINQIRTNENDIADLKEWKENKGHYDDDRSRRIAALEDAVLELQNRHKSPTNHIPPEVREENE